MKFFTVYIQFRNRGIPMHVHQFDSYYLVGFTDIDVIQDFGGLLEFDLAGKSLHTGRQPKDALDLYREIREALKAG